MKKVAFIVIVFAMCFAACFDLEKLLTLNRFSLEVEKNPVSGGNVRVNGNVSGGKTLHLGDAVVNVCADTATGYKFVSWTGALLSDDMCVELIMDEDKSFTANFCEIGANCGSDIGACHIDVANRVCNNNATREDCANENGRFEYAELCAIYYALDVDLKIIAGQIGGMIIKNVDGEEAITVSSRTATHFLEGTRVEVCADTAEGYSFYGWSGDLSADADSTDACLDVVMDSDKELTATFNRYYTLTIRRNVGGGDVFVKIGDANEVRANLSGNYRVAMGTEVTLRVAITGCGAGFTGNVSFNRWQIATNPYQTPLQYENLTTDNPLTFTMDSSMTIRANLTNSCVAQGGGGGGGGPNYCPESGTGPPPSGCICSNGRNIVPYPDGGWGCH